MKKKLLLAAVIAIPFCCLNAQKEVEDAAIYYRANGNARLAADAEIFQATIKKGVSANQFLIYIRPNQIIPVGSIFAGGAPQVAFSVLGNTAIFTPTFNLGASGVSTSTEVAGGRSRMVVGATAGTNTLVLPWPANEERLAFTVNITGDDTVGARIEHDVNLGQYTLYVADQPTASDWTHYTTPLYAGGPGAFTGQDGIYLFATIPSSGVLPVAFASFNANCNDKGALLTWSTATEQNSDFFEVQRSTNGSDWKAVDKVAAAGTSFVLREYQYLDLESGNVQYRIRQVDLDGKETYTNIRRTSCDGKAFSSALFPVPAKDRMTLVVRSDRAVTTNLQFMDAGGRIVKQMRTNINNGNTNISIDVSALPQGEYLLTSSDPAVRISKKFVVAR